MSELMHDPAAEMGAILVDQFNRLCSRFTTADHMDSAGDMASELWVEITQAGFQNALLADEHGGYGVTPVQAMGLVRAAASLAMPVPLAETMLALSMHGSAGGAGLEGTLSFAWEIGTASERPDGWLVTAKARAVPYGRYADQVLMPVRCKGGLQLAPMSVAQAQIVPNHNLAGEPRDTLAWSDVLVSRQAAPDIASEYGEAMLVAGAFIRSQQMIGAMQRALGHAVTYARERKQFGQSIGRFQAVQQMLAVAVGHLAAATAAADAAAEAYGSDEFGFAVAVAKSRVGEAAGIVASTCHQVMGAMGFTREHELHKVTRRLWAWRDEYGSEAIWQERIGRRICAAGGERLWQTVVNGSPSVAGGNRYG